MSRGAGTPARTASRWVSVRVATPAARLLLPHRPLTPPPRADLHPTRGGHPPDRKDRKHGAGLADRPRRARLAPPRGGHVPVRTRPRRVDEPDRGGPGVAGRCVRAERPAGRRGADELAGAHAQARTAVPPPTLSARAGSCASSRTARRAAASGSRCLARPRARAQRFTRRTGRFRSVSRRDTPIRHPPATVRH